MAAYRAALFGDRTPATETSITGLPDERIEFLIGAYIASPSWKNLSSATQRQRRNIFDRLRGVAGSVKPSDITTTDIKRRRDELGPGAAKHFVQTMRGLYQWAKEQGYVDHDPTEGVKVSRPKTDGFATWDEADIAAYREKWTVGTRERLWLEILLHTGLRRGDACLLGHRHVNAGVIELCAAKTGTAIVLPLAPVLADIIAASPIGTETFIATIHGKPMSKEFFGNLFREACNKAGVTKSAHGLRKAAAVRLAEAGATVPELCAVFGWSDSKMAMHYCRESDRKRLARNAMERLKK